MRLSIRLLGFVLIFITVFLQCVNILSYNIRYDELNTIVSTAMETTQFVVKEQMENNYTDADTKKNITSNGDYLKEFKNNLIKQVTSNSEYKIYVYGIDYEKGLLDLRVDCEYSLWGNMNFNISTRKCSIVEKIEG